MMHEAASWRNARRTVLVLTALAPPLVCSAVAPANAQNAFRPPSINVAPRLPQINPNVAGTAALRATTPNLTIRQGCSYAYRSSNGECNNDPGSTANSGGTGNGNGSGATGNGAAGNGKSGGSRNNAAITALNLQTVANQLVAELNGNYTDEQADALGRRHRLRRLGSQNFPLIGATIGLFQITDGRSAEAARRDLATDAAVRSVQLNYRHFLQEQQAAPTEGDPAQYVVAKMRLAEAHTLAHGTNVRIAVIDSAIDTSHPELSSSVIKAFDALGSSEGAHVHGTGVAGAIASHGRLIGSAPGAQLLAIRAFGKGKVGEESNSYVVLKALDFAAANRAQIVNMSFAGPKDPLIERSIDALAGKGIIMIAAAGNAGAKSPPLYPAANPNVIAVSGTDAQDKLFTASNRGSYIAVAAPGADIFLPAPDQKYQMTSGTSFSAAYVSGVAALMLERNPALKADELRAILTRTARDLGSPGRDDQFGAGEADAFAATEAANAATATPVVPKEPAKASETAPEQTESPQARPQSPPIAAMASDKSTAIQPNGPASQ
jgi:Subtilase family